MKKLINKFRKRKKLPPPSRITSETIEQHREHVLAGGRRFKYPLQYARHKLVINAILISFAAVIIAIAIAWWQLYPNQSTSEFMYRVTRVIPVPVAYVDGQPALYSDYLMKYLSQVHYLVEKEKMNPKTDDGKRQIAYIKQRSMQEVIEDAYAVKLSKKLRISVTEQEIQASIKTQRITSDGTETTEQAYNAIILDFYNWSPDEYKHVTEMGLLRQKVAFAMDKNAFAATESTYSVIQKDSRVDLRALASTTSSQSGLNVTYGLSGWVPKNNQNGGLAAEAVKLKPLEVSGIIKSTIGDGYYVIRLIDANAEQVSYEYINVPLTKFTKSLDGVIKAGKVSELISIPKS